MIDRGQFSKLIKEVLDPPGLFSDSALNLLLGTAAQESQFCTYLRQLGKGPALGFFQMEPATEADHWDHFIVHMPALSENLKLMYGYKMSNPYRLVWDIRYMIVMCRVHYLRVPSPLPDAEDIEALATYWKDHYNTHLGAGTREEFIRNYARYVLG